MKYFLLTLFELSLPSRVVDFAAGPALSGSRPDSRLGIGFRSVRTGEFGLGRLKLLSFPFHGEGVALGRQERKIPYLLAYFHWPRSAIGGGRHHRDGAVSKIHQADQERESGPLFDFRRAAAPRPR